MSAAEAMVNEQVRYWQIRGITVNDAWCALGHSRRHNATWAMVRECMTRWLLAQDAALPAVKRAA